MVNSDRIFKVAIVGCGRMGALTTDACRKQSVPGYLPLSHAEAVTTLPEFELSALCDTDPQNLARARLLFKITTTYSDYKLLVKEIKPDIVSVATRTPVRCEIINFCAQNGIKGIYAEKPFSRSLAECDSALETLRRNDCKLVCGTMRRFMPIYSIAAEACRSGSLGILNRITVEYGKTLLMWNHPHSIDAILFLSGETSAREVCASCEISNETVNDLLIDSDPLVAHATIQFDSGMLGQISDKQSYAINVEGSMGELTIAKDGEMLRISRIGTCNGLITKQYWAKDFTGPSGTQRGFLNLANAISSNGDTAFSFEEINLTQRLLLSIAWSEVSGRKPVDPFKLAPQLTVSGHWNGTFA